MPSPILAALVAQLHRTKRMAERAFEQLDEPDFFFRLSPRQNSIHVIVKHLSGNMRSRWADFLTTDGEKPGRDRESEFVEDVVPRGQILRSWESGWAAVFAALDPLTDADLTRTVRIRGELLTVAEAVVRQVEHYGYHVGQIVFLAKHLESERWTTLSVARGKSAEYRP